MSRNASLGEALRDIQKNGCEGDYGNCNKEEIIIIRTNQQYNDVSFPSRVVRCRNDYCFCFMS